MAEKLREFEHRCPKCKTVHQRTMWSIAHMDIAQWFTCPNCGKTSEIKPARKRKNG